MMHRLLEKSASRATPLDPEMLEALQRFARSLGGSKQLKKERLVKKLKEKTAGIADWWRKKVTPQFDKRGRAKSWAGSLMNTAARASGAAEAHRNRLENKSRLESTSSKRAGSTGPFKRAGAGKTLLGVPTSRDAGGNYVHVRKFKRSGF